MKQFFTNQKVLFVLYVLLAVVVSVQIYSMGAAQQFNRADNPFYTTYNNFIIYKSSFLHLRAGLDMYVTYPAEHYDLFKYSPTFAFFMGGFAWLPNWLGLMLWDLLNVLALFFAIRMLPVDKGKVAFMLLFIIVELVTATQNSQTNALLVALVVASFGFMEKRQVILATLMLGLATYIKVYGAIGFCFFLLYPNKLKFIGWSAIWAIVLLLLPLMVTTPDMLVYQYESWINMMLADRTASYGLSIMGALNKLFGIVDGKNIVSVLGLVLFFVPFFRYKQYGNKAFKLLLLGSALIWLIIFNHKAESATYIIAVTGIAIWYAALPATNMRTIILVLAFVFACLSVTELFAAIRDSFTERYAVKPLACLAVWVYGFVELMRIDKKEYV